MVGPREINCKTDTPRPRQHFSRYAPETIEYGITRYTNETRRLYSVLDAHLASSESGYLVGDHVSIADITHWGWVSCAGWSGVNIEEFPNLKKWFHMMLARDGIEKGRHVPEPHKMRLEVKSREETEEEAKVARDWVLAGMKADAKK